jgi:hypothetical protein
MIDAHFAESLAVSYGHEDFNGLYELVWGLNSSHPEVVPGERLRAAQAALLSLVSRGLLAVFAAEQPLQNPQPVASASVERVLSDPESWLPPGERAAPHYCFATTEAGERSYLAGEFESL